MANSADPNQTAPKGAVCSGSTLLASVLNSSVMLDNYLQLTTSADDIFRCIFSWRFKSQQMSSALSSAEMFGSKKDGKEQESIQSCTTADPVYHMGK